MPARPRLRRLLVGLALPAAIACGDDGDTSAPREAGVSASVDTATPWAERVESQRVAELLAALDQSHATARTAYGPHRLRTRAVFDLAPPPSDEAPRPALDQPVVAPQHVEDELELRWAAAPGEPPAFALAQSNDRDRGREVVVVDDRVYVRKKHRAWVHYPVESDLFERWLDDGYHAVRDAVQLAAPKLAYTTATRAGEGLSGGDAIEVTLSLADALDPSLLPSDPTRTWRAEAEIESVRGTIVLDSATGLWLSADIDVDYGLAGAEGRPLAGNLQLTASIEAGPQASGPVEPPADASPLPERTRYEVQAERLLDGLGAP